MRVLVACEESQAVCIAFRERGHEAYSCDIQPCSGGHPEWHIQDDVLKHLNDGWDMMIAFPPCTYLSTIGMNWQNRIPGRKEKTEQAIEFVKALWSAHVGRIAIENPIGVLNTRWRKPSQIIEPYYFGDPEKKATCLWLKGLKRLNGTTPFAKKPEPSHVYANGRKQYFGARLGDKLRYSPDRGKMKSKTFPGIARAMAEQWGSLDRALINH